jgi:hypothetical protein
LLILLIEWKKSINHHISPSMMMLIKSNNKQIDNSYLSTNKQIITIYKLQTIT